MKKKYEKELQIKSQSIGVGLRVSHRCKNNDKQALICSGERTRVDGHGRERKREKIYFQEIERYVQDNRFVNYEEITHAHDIDKNQRREEI